MTRPASDDYTGPDRRQNILDTRTPPPEASAARSGAAGEETGLERRRGPGRRRSDFMKSAEEGEMTPEQFLFIKAIDAYKRVNQRPFPTWTEVLEVIRKLGYRKTADMSLDIPGAEDWTEPADAPAFPAPEPEAEAEAA
ncbi:MAG: hypothetical protein AAF800_03115 [Planctomycetota bacterium]